MLGYACAWFRSGPTAAFDPVTFVPRMGSINRDLDGDKNELPRYHHRQEPVSLVTVGWDKPMQTFFAQVERKQDDEDPRDPILLWLGTRSCEHVSPAELVAPLEPYAVLDGEIMGALDADRIAGLNRGPTALQRLISSRRG